MRITTKSNALVILLEGKERWWALKASICVQLDDVISVTWNPEKPDPKTFSGRIRLPGTSVPKVFHAGSFWSKSGWEFWYLHMAQAGELIITMDRTHYRIIRLSTDEATAFEVREWFNKKQQTRNIA